MKCNQCGTIVNDGVSVCPTCGNSLEEQKTNILKLDDATQIPKPIPIPSPIEQANNNVQPVEQPQVINNPLPVQPIPVPQAEPVKTNAIQAFPDAFNPSQPQVEPAVVDEPMVSAPPVQPIPVEPTPVVTPQPVVQPVVPPTINYAPNPPQLSAVTPVTKKQKSNTGLAILTAILGIVALVIVILVIMNFMSNGQPT